MKSLIYGLMHRALPLESTIIGLLIDLYVLKTSTPFSFGGVVVVEVVVNVLVVVVFMFVVVVIIVVVVVQCIQNRYKDNRWNNFPKYILR